MAASAAVPDDVASVDALLPTTCVNNVFDSGSVTGFATVFAATTADALLTTLSFRVNNHIACRARNAGWQRFRVTVIAVVFFVVGILVWVGSWVGLVPKQFTWICILGFLNPYNMCSSRSPELMRGILGEFGFFYMTAALLVCWSAHTSPCRSWHECPGSGAATTLPRL